MSTKMSTKDPKASTPKKYSHIRVHREDDLILSQVAAMHGKTKIDFVKEWLQGELTAMSPTLQEVVQQGVANRKSNKSSI